jgi:hypothetical protein
VIAAKERNAIHCRSLRNTNKCPEHDFNPMGHGVCINIQCNLFDRRCLPPGIGKNVEMTQNGAALDIHVEHARSYHIVPHLDKHKLKQIRPRCGWVEHVSQVARLDVSEALRGQHYAVVVCDLARCKVDCGKPRRPNNASTWLEDFVRLPDSTERVHDCWSTAVETHNVRPRWERSG